MLLGELEHLVLLAIVRLGDDAYGAAIIGEIETHTKRDVSHAATYLALQRLQAKGLILARKASVETERGGRPRATFSLTRFGHTRLADSGAALFAMWSGVNPALRSRGRS
jgi:DNA-binding PadR family transcriptional regulator